MLPDFLLNLAANLAWEWLQTVSRRLRDLGFGDAQSRAFRAPPVSHFYPYVSGRPTK